MLDWAADRAIQKDARGGGAPQQRKNVTPSLAEAQLLQDLKQVFPAHTVERFGYVKLDEQHGCLGAMEVADGSLHVLEVVMYRSFPDECALST